MNEESGENIEERPVAVYDCMVFVQAAFRGYGPAAACLEAAADGRVRLFASDTVLAEVEDVLSRPAVRRRRRHLTADFVSAFLQRLRSIAVVIERAPERFSYARDPDDEPYLNLAVEVGAEYLVSRDNDLLDLQKPDSKPGGDLRQLLPRLAILDPVEFLRILSPPPDAPPQLILKKQSLTTSKVNVLPAGLSLHVLTARRLQGIRFKRVIARTQMLRARRVGDTENIPDVRWIRLIRRIAEVS
ncbi:MAG TPA: putative toxin-antitoxin system toxin component, PIN family [Armatimonadota bacterium]|nr:putative toxin-antitoxin system toxin component, PIN family [Armatimonadota bacterium]